MIYGYSEEELEVVRKTISRALEERGIRAGRVEMMERCRFNLKAEIRLIYCYSIRVGSRDRFKSLKE